MGAHLKFAGMSWRHEENPGRKGQRGCVLMNYPKILETRKDFDMNLERNVKHFAKRDT
jgi:hypothetical protein